MSAPMIMKMQNLETHFWLDWVPVYWDTAFIRKLVSNLMIFLGQNDYLCIIDCPFSTQIKKEYSQELC